MKKTLALFLTLVMIFGLLPVFAVPAYANAPFPGGGGSPSNPYLISAPEHLSEVNNHLDTHFLQVNDIDLSNQNFAIGALTGTYDGGGHRITGFNGNERGGLFSSNSGTIKNLHLSGAVSATLNVPNLGAQSLSLSAGGIVGTNDGTIDNCVNSVKVSVSGSTNSSTSYQQTITTYAGGIAGTNNGMITNCCNTGDVSSSSIASSFYYPPKHSAYAYAGGIAGNNQNGTITNSYNKGTVNATAAKFNGSSTAVSYNNDISYNGTVANCNNSLNTLNTGSTAWVADTYNINGGAPILAWQLMDPDAPILSADLQQGFYSSIQNVSLSVTDSSYDIYYTTDGTNPRNGNALSAAARKYESALRIYRSAVLWAVGYKDGAFTKNLFLSYTLPEAEVVADKIPGEYTEAITVTLDSVISGFDIRYTTDGTTPTAASALYSQPIDLTKTTTLKAVAVYGGYVGPECVFAYSIYPTIKASVAPGNYTSSQSVALTSSISGYAIHYTTDGTTPTAASTRYTTPITVSGSTTIKAIAVSGAAASDVFTFEYRFLIQISTAAELFAIRNKLDEHYIQTADIDLTALTNGGMYDNGGTGWTPVGTAEDPFTGSYNGSGYVIKGLRMEGGNANNNTTRYFGLFGVIEDAVISNVKMRDVNINLGTPQMAVGAVVGLSRNSRIFNCEKSGNIWLSNILDSSQTASAKAGGIAGEVDGGLVEKCVNTGQVTASAVASAYAGGIAGHIYNNAVIDMSKSTAASPSTTVVESFVMESTYGKESVAGGIAGISVGTSGQANGTVRRSYNTGRIFASGGGTSVFAGGISGYSGIIENCYNLGNISLLTGGSRISMACSGGISGYTISNISLVYNTGDVTHFASGASFSARGGIAGGRYDSSIKILSAFATNLYGSSYGLLRTETQMKTQDSFGGFDFTDIWRINSGKNNGTPYMQWEDVTEIQSYNGSAVSVYSDKQVYGAIVVLAEYEGGNLVRLQVKQVDLAAGKSSSVPISGKTTGVKIFLWKSAEGMEPLCEPLTQ